MSDNTKTAVDNAARDYWSKYFGAYGKMWVREIPRRIKAAMTQGKTASADTSAPDPHIVPSGHVLTSNGGIDLEGALREDSGTYRLFHASFDAEGTVTSFRTYGAVQAPARAAE